jgi:hypothetical protein
VSLKKTKIVPLNFDTYLAVIENSVGSKMFQNLFASVDGVKKDIIKKGDLSCAFFVSAVLTIFGFIKAIHSTVAGTEKDLLVSGWKKVSKPKPGDVLIWEERKIKDETHKHIGFFIGKNWAISNDSKKRIINKHHWTYHGQRKVVAVYHRLIVKK